MGTCGLQGSVYLIYMYLSSLASGFVAGWDLGFLFWDLDFFTSASSCEDLARDSSGLRFCLFLAGDCVSSGGSVLGLGLGIFFCCGTVFGSGGSVLGLGLGIFFCCGTLFGSGGSVLGLGLGIFFCHGTLSSSAGFGFFLT